MSNILSRIQKITLNEGITIGALERKIGASKGVLSRAINNGTDIQSKWIGVLVDNYPQYSTRWLLTGHGFMLRNDSDAAKNEIPVVGCTPNATPISISEESFIYKMYEKEKEEKESKVEELTAKMLQMAEEIGSLKNQLSQYEPKTEGSIEKVKGLGHAKSVSTGKPSSPNANNVTSAIAQ